MKLFPLCSLIFGACLFSIGSSVFAQTNAQNVYVSAIDQDLAIKTIVLIPPTDNVGGIYSRPVAEEMRALLNNDKQWSLAEMPKDLKIKSETLDENPADVQKILKAANSESAISTKIIRGPRGLSITMTLYVGRDGLPLVQDALVDYQGFDLSEVRAQVRRQFENIKYKMPFRATVLSRRGQQVTLNLGSNYGLKTDGHVSVVQIIKVNRHPKLNFMVSTEKEVLGRIRLFKVEPYLSFGYVEMEKEPGVITVGSKVLPDEFVKYSTPITTPSGKVLQDISTRPDKEVAFGENPKEWLPESNPQFGKVQLLAGISQYTQNAKLTDGSSVNGSSNFAPNLMVRGEIWLNTEWFMSATLRQSVFSIDNNLNGSTPGSVNMSMSQYGVSGGYNFLLTNDFFGPKLQVSGGYVNTNFSVDDTTPEAYTKMQYSGLLLGLAGQFPVSEEVPVDIGAKFDLYVNPSLNESGKTSGSSSTNKINSFGFFVDYRMQKRFKIHGELLFEYYDSDFSGTGTRTTSANNISHRMTTLLGGVEYSF